MGRGQKNSAGGGGRSARAGGILGSTVREGPGPYRGGRVRWSASLRNEASYRADTDILLGPKFFDLEPEGRVAVLAHEMGHGLMDRTGALSEYRFDASERALRENNLRARDGYVWGLTSVEEAGAESLMVFALRPAELKRSYPAAYRWAQAVYRTAGVSPAELLRQVRAIVEKARRGDPNSVETIASFEDLTDG